MLGGIIAGALGQGAKDVSDIAQGQIDVNTKQQLASFQSQLETERAQQAARLAQTIGREDRAFNASPEGLAQSAAVKANDIRTTALTSAAPDVLAANNNIEASKPREIPFGGELHQYDPITGADKTLAKNKTPLEDFRYPRSGAAGAAGAEARKDHWTAQEEEAGQRLLESSLKGFTDMSSGSAVIHPVAQNAALQAYNDALEAGSNPRRAAQMGTAAASNAMAAVAAARKSAPDQTKGMSDYEIFQALDRARRSAAAPAGPKPATDSAPTPSPAKDPAATMGNPAPAPKAAPTPSEPGLIDTIRGQLADFGSKAIAEPPAPPAPPAPPKGPAKPYSQQPARRPN